MMNVGRWDDARESLDKARKASPKADHIHYALAALDCLTGEADSALGQFESRHSIARGKTAITRANDEDFCFPPGRSALHTELLYPEKDGTAG